MNQQQDIHEKHWRPKQGWGAKLIAGLLLVLIFSSLMIGIWMQFT